MSTPNKFNTHKIGKRPDGTTLWGRVLHTTLLPWVDLTAAERKAWHKSHMTLGDWLAANDYKLNKGQKVVPTEARRTPRIKDRSSAGYANMELLEPLHMTDGQIAGNLGKNVRTVQRWTIGAHIDETAHVLLGILGMYPEVDLRAVRKKLGLEVF